MNQGLMRRSNLWVAVLLIIAVLPLSACGGTEEAADGNAAATIEPVEGTDLGRITLTADAAKRLDIQIAPVEATGEGTQQRTVIPYSAVFYESNGETWAYTSPEDLTFVRESIVIDDIDGDLAVLSSGPPPGTMVATVGVAELFGTESGVGGD
ncbi:MAG: hypothetical protein M3526_06875 [Actinomycetota bacterium]|nr:hypothetical protein [Actinomycetota bacterium]